MRGIYKPSENRGKSINFVDMEGIQYALLA